MGKRIAGKQLDRDEVDGDSEEYQEDPLGSPDQLDSAD
jgi:hypothetical protein